MVSKPPFVPRLVVIEGHDKGKVIPLKNGTAIIGRSKGDIVIPDPRISRSHVAIQYDQEKGRLSFTDLKSLNGTFLNGEESKQGVISDGDRLQVGDTIFDCQMTKPDTSLDISTGPREGDEVTDMTGIPAEPVLAPEPPLSRPTSDLAPLEEEPLEPQAMSASPRQRSKRSFGVRSFYLRIPVRKRIQLLSLLTIVVGVIYLAGEPGGEGPGKSSEVDRIRRQALSGGLESAIAQAEALTAKTPTDSEAHLLLGDLYAIQTDFQKAVIAYRRAAAMENPNPVVHVKLIRMYLITKNNQGAMESYSKLGEAIQNTGKLLSAAINEQNLSPQEAVAKNPYIKDLFVETAQLFLDFKELDEPPEQLMLIARALQKDIAPTNPVGYKLEAHLLFRQNQTESAVALLEKAFALNQRDRWVIENLALAKYRLQDYPGTERIVTAWIENFPDSSRAYLTMAYLKFTQRQPQAALPFLEKILELGQKNPKEPYYPEALYWVGQVFLASRRSDEAVQYVKQACELGYQLGCESPLVRVPSSPPARESETAPEEDAAATDPALTDSQ